MVGEIKDFRGAGAPQDIGTFQFNSEVILYKHTFNGITYVCAARSGSRGWIPVSNLPTSAANDATVLQNGFDEAGVGGTVTIMPAEYNVGAQVNINYVMVIYAYGAIFNSEVANTYMFRFNNLGPSPHLNFRQLPIWRGGRFLDPHDWASWGFLIEDSCSVTIADVCWRDYTRCIEVYNDDAYCESCRFVNLFMWAEQYGIYFNGGVGSSFAQTALKDIYINVAGGATGIYLSDRVYFTRCHLDNVVFWLAADNAVGLYTNAHMYNARVHLGAESEVDTPAVGVYLISIGPNANMPQPAHIDEYHYDLEFWHSADAGKEFTQVVYNPNDRPVLYGRSALMEFSHDSTIPAGTTTCIAQEGANRINCDTAIPVPHHGFIQNLSVRVDGNGTNAASTFTVMINGVASALSLSVPAGTIGCWHERDTRVAMTPCDAVGIQVVVGGTAGGLWQLGVSVEYQY